MPTLTEMCEALQAKLKEDKIYKRIEKAMADGDRNVIFQRANDINCDDPNFMHPIMANKLASEGFNVTIDDLGTHQSYSVGGWDRF